MKPLNIQRGACRRRMRFSAQSQEAGVAYSFSHKNSGLQLEIVQFYGDVVLLLVRKDGHKATITVSHAD